MINKDSTIYVSGHTGLVGTAILKSLKKNNYNNIITRKHSELELLDKKAVDLFFNTYKIDCVIVASAKVGGIGGNSKDNAGFLYENSILNFNIINSAFRHGVKKLIFLGSSCIYPKYCKQPIKESYLLTDSLERTNEGYALAKISGIKYCEYLRRQYNVDYQCLMPCNLYGYNDNYNLQTGHVLPCLIRRFYEAKTYNFGCITLWGDGSPIREFLHADDLGDCVVECLNYDYLPYPLNVGSGLEISISTLAELIKTISDYKGNVIFNNNTSLNGTPRKILDSSTIKESTYWRPKIGLMEGLKLTYEDYCKNNATLRK